MKQGYWVQKTTLCAPSAKAAQAAGVRNKVATRKREDDPGPLIGLGVSHRDLRVGVFPKRLPGPDERGRPRYPASEDHWRKYEERTSFATKDDCRIRTPRFTTRSGLL